MKIQNSKINKLTRGKNCTIVKPVNIYNCSIGNEVFIGPFSEIQEKVYVADNTRIQSHSFICSNTIIGKKCFISHGATFINDKFINNRIASKDNRELERTILGNNVLIGSNATILPIRICDNVVIGAGSVVTKNISKPGVYAGNPAKKIKSINKKLNIGVITYDRHHSKSQRLIEGLLKKKKYNIHILTSEYKTFKNKKKYNFNHRPYQFKGKDPKEISKKYKIPIYNLKEINKLNFIDYFLIGGSQLISKRLIKSNRIINSHTGLIPMSRGLDSLKWAIKNNDPIGTSLHFIDEEIDMGFVFNHSETKILKNDNFKNFAKRHYEIEVKNLINFEDFLWNGKILNLKFLKIKNATKRMTPLIEKNMSLYFKNYKKKLNI